MILVSKASKNELESICALDRMLGNSSRKDFLTRAVSDSECLVARIEDNVVGFAVLEQSFYGQGFISLLRVHSDYRRKGVAKALIRNIEASCPTEKLFTSTNKSNIIAQQVFEALGFAKSGYVENLDEGDPEIIYFKRLGGNKKTLT